MDAKNRNGIYRNDYHRRNRKANISMHSHSHGRNIPIETTLSHAALQIPNFTRESLTQRAIADWRDHHDAEYRLSHKKTSSNRKCFEFIRHRQTSLDRATARLYGAAYLLAIRQFCDAVTDRYDWLRDECERYYKKKAGQKKFQTFRVVKTVTQMQVEDINFYEEQKPDDPITEEEEIPAYFNALSSLHQERFMYLPPFLKADQIRERRFGDNANDNWWEWEEELGLTATEGRPDPKNAQQ